jgi:hypothetical protein
MRSSYIALSVCGLLLAPVTAAIAQGAWVPGSELVGHSAQVTTNGVVNTVYFDPGGAARIVSARGTTMPATWSAANGSLCLSTGGAQECWPYMRAFQPGQAQTLTSNCQSVSTWQAMSTNQSQARGERG